MSAAAAVEPAPRGISRRSIALAVFYFGLAAILVLVFGSGIEAGEETIFGLNLGAAPAIKLPDLVVPGRPSSTSWPASPPSAGRCQLTRALGARWAILITIALIAFVFGFLTWTAAGKSMSLVGVLQTTLYRAVPITFGALSGVLCERAGVVNIAIEGMLLSGAFVAAVVASATGNNWLGVIGAVIAGALLATVLAVLSIRYRVNQIIAGHGDQHLRGWVSQASSPTRVLQQNQALNTPDTFDPIVVPVLSDIPIMGPVVLQRATSSCTRVFVADHRDPLRALLDALGAPGPRRGRASQGGRHGRHQRHRSRATRTSSSAGMVAGFGGAYFTVGSTGTFEREMTAGRGFIGLAAMIFGGWTPIGAFLASLVFGFADALQSRLSILGSQVPSEFLLMVPYIMTIVVVAGLVGRVRMPAADGTPYVKE